MRAFKFLKSSFVPGALSSGRFSVGTLVGFRRADEYDDGRADGEEGVTRFCPLAGPLNDEQKTDFLRLFDREHLADQCQPLIFQDTEIFVDTDCYLMCFVDQLTELMVMNMAHRLEYDACLEISDLAAFCQGVTEASECLQTPFPKQPEACWSCGPVDYRQKDNLRIEDSPFIKRPQFSWQREWRCVWPGRAPRDSFLVDAPKVISLLSQVDLTQFKRQR